MNQIPTNIASCRSFCGSRNQISGIDGSFPSKADVAACLLCRRGLWSKSMLPLAVL